ncbi:MAG: MBL fold metallo-hydrolase [Gemmatimonadota bacterium]|jgi:hydroxyacylglutathione hydrolase|nr:MBL fold metallo-hydrolase [Gemmatimonadota bacterium]
MLFRQFFDPKLAQYAYLVGCQRTGEALIIDPERDIDRYIEAAKAEGLRIVAVAETHIHADFLSGAREFAHLYGTDIYLSDEGGADWASDWARGGNYRTHFLRNGESFYVGEIEVQALHTPGHTPEHMSWLIIDRGGGASTPMGIATGDFIFVGDIGRPDLLEQAAGIHGIQEPSARQLYASLPRFRALEEHLQVWPAHGAGSTCGKALGAVPQTTVGYEKRYNASLSAAEAGENAFVSAILSGQPEPQMYFARMKRDNNRGVPVLGGLPRPEEFDAMALRQIVHQGHTLVIDTRTDRERFMAGHIPGALFAPISSKLFNTFVGSLVIDETQPILLVIEPEKLEEAVRDLVRIGYDNLIGFATPDTLATYFAEGGPKAEIRRITFAGMKEMMSQPENAVLDVRFTTERDEQGAVPASAHAPYTRLPSYLEDRVPKGRKLLVHCQTGVRAAVCSSFLAREGFDVVHVDEPYSAWQALEAARL